MNKMMRSELVDSLSKPAYGVKPLSARQLNAMQMSFRWLMVVYFKMYTVLVVLAVVWLRVFCL